MHSISDLITYAANVLRESGVPEHRREAGALLSHSLAVDRTFLITHADDRVSESDFESYGSLVQRRAAGEPLQYITGRQDFFGREFRVTPDVLIPRPETELLVEAALTLLPTSEERVICDVGTGSGCIAISILCERPNARAIGIDISAAAIDVAKQNAETLEVSSRIEFVMSDCFANLDPSQQSFDLILSNPPYVSSAMLSGLQREVRDHEPLIALSPGEDGLAVIRRILEQAPAFLPFGGHLLLEIGFDQGETLQQMIEPAWRLVDILPDLQGIPRIAILRKVQSLGRPTNLLPQRYC